MWELGGGLAGKGRLIGEVDDVVSGVSLSMNSKTLATAGGDGAVRLWDVASGRPLGSPLVDGAVGFQSVKFSPDGAGLVAGNNDGAVLGWTLPSGQPLFDPVRGAHTSNVLKLVFSPDGDRFATSSNDGTSVVIDYPSGDIVGPAFGGATQIGAVVFGPHGKVLIGGDSDGAVRQWDIARDKLLDTTPSGHSREIVDIGLSDDGALLATLARDQLIRLWTFPSTRLVAAAFRVAGRAAKGVVFSADGGWLAAGDDSGAVRVWRLDAEDRALEISGHGHQVWALASAPDGSLIASGDRSGHVRLWKPADGTLVRAFEAHEAGVWSLGFTPDGKRLMTASDLAVRLWDIDTGARLKDFPQDSGRITRAVLAPDGEVLAVAATDGRIRLWQLDDERPAEVLTVGDDVIWSVAFSPDGRHLASASSSEAVTLWDRAERSRVATLAGHKAGATDAAFLADGATLVVLDRSGQLHLWDIDSGRRLAEPWQAHSGPSWRIALHPDGERFATAGDDAQVRIWDQLSIARACEIGGAAFDETRHMQYLGEGGRSLACGPGT